MKIAVAFDHRGIVLRDRILAELNALRCDVIDLGTDSDRERVDYPDKAQELGAAIYSGTADRGILVCSSGVGAAIAACKLPRIRASICHDPYSARQGVEHDALNVLCLGSEIVGGELAAELVRIYVEARFRGSERHVRRLQKLEALDRRA